MQNRLSNRFRVTVVTLAFFSILSFTVSKCSAQSTNQPYSWIPLNSQRLQTLPGACIYNNLLWQWDPNAFAIGLTAFDGKKTLQGGKAVGTTVQTLHPTGSGLYATVSSARATIEVKSLQGAFLVGERVTQLKTGAKGVIVHKHPQQFILISRDVPFDTSAITGDSSHAVLTPKSVTNDTSFFLERSMTGFDDFVPVLDVPYRLKMRGLVDCGNIKFSDKATRLLLAFDDPIVDGQFAHVYYNLPDVDNSWKLLMETKLPNGERPIRHFHGAIWLPGKKAGTGRLIAMTGDYDTEASLLVCDDVADLIAHPGNWKTNWGLDRTGDDRVNYLKTKGKPYCIGAGTQEYRVIDILTDAEGKYAYYIPDTHTLTYLMQIDLQNKTAKQFGSVYTQGFGWMALQLSNGLMLFSAASEFRRGGYQGNSDQYVHLYAFKPGDADIVEVFKTLRADYKAPTQARGNFVNVLEYNNALWLLGENTLNPVTVGVLVEQLNASSRQKQEDKALSSVLKSLTSKDYLEGHGFFSLANVALWNPTKTTLKSDASVTYSGITPAPPSLACTPSSVKAGMSIASLFLNPKLLADLKGRWITLITFVHTAKPNEKIGASVYIAPFGSSTELLTTTGGWDPLIVTTFVPSNATDIRVDLLPRMEGNLGRRVWFSSTTILRGAMPH